MKRIIQTLDDSDDEKVDENTEENQEEFSDHVDMSTQEQSQLRSTCEYFILVNGYCYILYYYNYN